VALTAVQLDSTVKVAAAARKIPRDITYSPQTNTTCKLQQMFISSQQRIKVVIAYDYNYSLNYL
jgi:hypothetical protein